MCVPNDCPICACILMTADGSLIVRDPILYLGRCGIFLFMCLVFALVYLNGRDNKQDQAFNKFWVMVWFIAVPSNMGVVAVYSLNDEFKSIIREAKNGMVSPMSYVLAKTILVFPMFFIFALFSHGIPLYLVQDAPGEAFVSELILYAAIMFVFESLAECLSVWFEDPVSQKRRRWQRDVCRSCCQWGSHACLPCCADSGYASIYELLVRCCPSQRDRLFSYHNYVCIGETDPRVSSGLVASFLEDS